MKKIDSYEGIAGWGYQDKRLGKGFAGTRDQIIIQVQNAYVGAGLDFREHEIPALVDNFMCEQGLARHCSERIEGLGDLVHIFAMPVARAMDRTFGTKLADCGGAAESPCAKKRRAMNAAVPL
jgi:hypothetical protein